MAIQGATKTLDINDAVIRCFAIKTKGKMQGQLCNWRIAQRNSKGEIAGELVCIECKAKYDIADNQMTFIGRHQSPKKKTIKRKAI